MDAQQQNIFLIISVLVTLFYFYQGYIYYLFNSITSATTGTIPKYDWIYV